MRSAAILAGVLLSLLHQVLSLEKIMGPYGQNIGIPCNSGGIPANEVFLIKWKYNKNDGTSGDLLVKPKDQEATISAPDEFKDRVSIDDDYSLRIAKAVLSDQKIYTCMIVLNSDISEHPVEVTIQKIPDAAELTNNPAAVETGKLTTIGQCSAKDAIPAAKIVWYKNREPMKDDGKDVKITASETVDPKTSLISTVSSLQYTAGKGDAGAQFSCGVEDTIIRSKPFSFTVNYPTEKVNLEVVTPRPFLERSDVTLKCHADGNPPPSGFLFNLKGNEVKVETGDSYTLKDVTREHTGEYKCSPLDNDSLVASLNITIDYLDSSLSPSGKIVKSAGETLPVKLQKDASKEVTVSWTKDNASVSAEPQFEKLKYSDSGLYECHVTMGTLSAKHSFQLLVEGAPVITSLREQISDDGTHKVLSCEAEGFPKPRVEWSGINGTNEESEYVNGKITHRLTVVPKANLTITCAAMNSLGMDSKTALVSPLLGHNGDNDDKGTLDRQDQSDDSGDQAKVAVGVIVGLLLAVTAVGLGYWFYTKKSKQGSWKTGEKEDGSTEESKKLEEAPQKAEV